MKFVVVGQCAPDQLNWRLYTDEDGDLVLAVRGQKDEEHRVLYITQSDGELWRFIDLPEDLGLRLDEDGSINVGDPV